MFWKCIFSYSCFSFYLYFLVHGPKIHPDKIIGNIISISQTTLLVPPKLKKDKVKKARVMIYFESCFSAILYSQTHFCTTLCFPANFSNGSKNKPNYFWCDHFKLEKKHQSLTFIINFNHKKKKKLNNLFYRKLAFFFKQSVYYT